jgi:hypothetical protein
MQDAEPLLSRRGRRTLIALLILLLILLPLYLWPLRGGSGGLPGASVLSGSPRDPRSAAAVARIPGDVWDALMGPAAAPTPSPPPTTPPRNLTMITQVEEFGTGLDQDAGGAPLSESPSSRARGMLAQLGGSSDPPGGADTPSAPGDFVSDSPHGGPGGGTGTGNPWSGFGLGDAPGFGNLGPWPGGGPGGGPRVSSPGPTFDPGNPGALEPTPEPATFVLVGANLALLGVTAWKRRRRVTRFGASATTFWRRSPF